MTPSSRVSGVAWLMALLLAPWGALASSAAGREKPLEAWEFDRPGDLQGWQPNADLTEVVVTNGTLSCRAVGADPILELRPHLNLAATPWQVVEIRLKADRDGMSELFWSNTSTGRYGGFAQEKTTRFNVTGDQRWHTYRLLPGWQAEGRIVRLRFDVYYGARFELDFLRVLELAMPPVTTHTHFNLSQGMAGWQWFGATEAPAPIIRPGGEWSILPTDLLLSPPLHLNADEQNYANVRMAVDRGRHATLYFITEHERGWHSFTFPIEAGASERTYHLDLLAAKEWRGQVLGLGLRPSDATNATARLAALSVSNVPEGPPHLKLVSFGLEDAMPRAGLPAKLATWVENDGGQAATNLTVRLELPTGMKAVSGPEREAGLPTLGLGEETQFTWTLQAARPMEGKAQLRLEAANTGVLSASAPVRFTAPLNLVRTGYVPEPKSVRGPFEVGVYYFPGWKTAGQWEPIRRFPERKPVLGWYREGEAEIADWQIKWAVEHGITFFAYDWYWSQGARQLEHALHDGYFQARYRHLLKFCLLWANHNPPRTSSPEDCLAVTRYWIENYFHRTEHLTFDGKPVMIIFSTDRLRADLGSNGVKRAFEAMREACRRAGLKGLYLIACVSEAGGSRLAAEEGYDAVTAYNWPHLGMAGEGLFAPYETLVPAYRRNWEHLLAESPIPLTPLPVCGGWDSRPWHGENNLVRFGRAPDQFKRHLLDAKQVLELRQKQTATPQAILIEAWNEWGEGSYIEPHNEFGFGYLEAIREVFTSAPPKHEDATPADAGLGPYDVPPSPAARTHWEFDSGDEGWGGAVQFDGLKAAGGLLSARTTGNDPAFFGPPMQARAGDFGTVVLRLRLSRSDGTAFTDTAQIFWRTRRLPESESASTRFPVRGDGQWHEYRIVIASNSRWRGVITRLRFDPCNQPGVNVDLDYLRLEK